MRLTDRARAAVLKAIIDRMEAGGYEVAEENRIYVKLAEYENAIDEDLQEEAKWPKENPALTPFIKQRFMKRR